MQTVSSYILSKHSQGLLCQDHQTPISTWFKQSQYSWFIGLLTLWILGRVTAIAWRQLPQTRDSPLPPWEIDHTTGVYVPYSFRTAVWVLLRPLPIIKEVWRRQLASGLTLLPNDAIIWTETRSLITFVTYRSADRRPSNWANRAAAAVSE